MKKLLLVFLFLVILAPVCAIPSITPNYPSQANQNAQFTISVTVDDSQGSIDNIKILREGINKVTSYCTEAGNTDSYCTFDWQTSEANVGKVTYRIKVENDYNNNSIIENNEITYSAPFTVDIIAAPANIPPTANAGPDQTVRIRDVVTFDGSGSRDIDGSIISYDWDFGDGNTGTGVAPTHTYTSPGTYTATLTVTDDDQATGTDTVDIIVRAGTYVRRSSGGSSRRSSTYSGAVPSFDTPKDKSSSSYIRKVAGEIGLSESNIEVESGETYRLPIIIKNTGSKATQYTVNIAGLQGNYEIEPAMVAMSPNQEITVYAYLSIKEEGQQVATISLVSDSQVLDGEALIINVQGNNYTLLLFIAVLGLVALITAAAYSFREF